MWIIVNIIQIPFIIVFFFFSVLSILLLPRKAIYWYTCNIWAPVTLAVAGMRLKVRGRENLDPNKPYFFVANHQSYSDIMICFAVTRRALHFIAKDELRKIPLLGVIMKKMGMIFVVRNKPGSSARGVMQAETLIKTGVNIIAFPEGTRSKDLKVASFKKGSFLIAAGAETEIIPIALSDPGKNWSRSNLRLRPGKVHVNIGKPISTKAYSKDNIQELVTIVQKEVERLKAESF